MKLLSCFLTLATLAVLAGCETETNLPEPPHTPRVALRYTLTTAPVDSAFYDLFQLRQLYVSNSQRVFDTRELPGRADATVDLRDAAGRVVERYRPIAPIPGPYSAGERGYYRPVLGFRPQAGQAYTLRASLPGMETAESTLTMPALVSIVSGSFTPGPNSNPTSDTYAGRLNVVVQDDPNANNYYLAFARVLDAQGQPGPAGTWSPVRVDYGRQGSSVSIGQFDLSSTDQGYSIYPFADTNLNGQRLALATDVYFSNYSCYQGNCTPAGFLEVTVSSITAEGYNFYLSRRRYFDSQNNPFAEPAPLAGNVRNGYGLFGGAADATYRIPL